MKREMTLSVNLEYRTMVEQRFAEHLDKKGAFEELTYDVDRIRLIMAVFDIETTTDLLESKTLHHLYTLVAKLAGRLFNIKEGVYVNKFVKFRINNRLKTTIGRCIMEGINFHTIEFNGDLFMYNSVETALSTVLHEMAHSVLGFAYYDRFDYRTFGKMYKDGHAWFEQLLRYLGSNSTGQKKINTKVYAYELECGCKGYRFTKPRTVKYVCSAHKTPIKEYVPVMLFDLLGR